MDTICNQCIYCRCQLVGQNLCVIETRESKNFVYGYPILKMTYKSYCDNKNTEGKCKDFSLAGWFRRKILGPKLAPTAIYKQG